MLKVKCFSDYRINQRPVSFNFMGKEFVIKEILDQWYGPGCLYFRVRDTDNHIYILKYDEAQDFWQLEFFRK